MEKVGYILPVGIVVMIFLLKLFINEKFSLENFKRLFVESSIDILSLAISFIISYIIAISNKIFLLQSLEQQTSDVIKMLSTEWEKFSLGLILLVVYIIFLVFVVFVAKYFISEYQEKESLKHIILGGIIGYIVATPCMIFSILLLKSLGGI